MASTCVRWQQRKPSLHNVPQALSGHRRSNEPTIKTRRADPRCASDLHKISPVRFEISEDTHLITPRKHRLTRPQPSAKRALCVKVKITTELFGAIHCYRPFLSTVFPLGFDLCAPRLSPSYASMPAPTFPPLQALTQLLLLILTFTSAPSETYLHECSF
eukprot:6172468-Pleurochrysis_carterae.AAC.2